MSGKEWSRLFLLSIPVLAGLLFCAGCEKAHPVNIGDTPPAISGNDINGEYVSLGKLKGKVVVIYFWTNSCCGASLKELEPFYSLQKYNGLEILAINELDSEKDVQSYARNNSLSFTQLTDERSMIQKQYRAFGFPTIFIVDRNGIVREKIIGAIQTADLEKVIARHLETQRSTP